MKLLKTLFPYYFHLTILQLEGYQPIRFLTWYFQNFISRDLPSKKNLVITSKVKLIIILALFWAMLSLYLLIKLGGLTGIIVFLLIASQPPIFLLVALFSLKPYEIINKQLIIHKTRKKIHSLKNQGLKIIAITGSFGKSSTKEILSQLIKEEHLVLKTPHSFNTLLGIAKVVDWELDNSYQYFICEMGAYKRGEIKELCQVILPDFGLITGITDQHLERFGSLKNTIQAKFELFDFIKDPKRMIFNLDDRNIVNELKHRRIKNPCGYGINNPPAAVQASKTKFSRKGSQFKIKTKNKNHSLKTSLWGYVNVYNILAALSVADRLDLICQTIVRRVQELKPFENRSELKKTERSVIINNTYSSNTIGFKLMTRTAAKLKGKKALVTPGIVELGKKETKIHQQLGKNCRPVFDRLVLVGRNNRTENLNKGFRQPKKTEFIKDSPKIYFEKIEVLKNSFDWIFLENDLTQNY